MLAGEDQLPFVHRDGEGLAAGWEGTRAEEKGGITVSPFGDLPLNTLCFCCPGPVDINIVAKCNACLSSPCKNNGTCSQDPVELYHCACPYGYKVRREALPPPLLAQGGGPCALLSPASPGAVWITPFHRVPQSGICQ